jgi:dTDP-4-amino-4,6-dideoxygalactose transaminase
MIKYLGEKNEEESQIRDLLAISGKNNHFTNNGPVKTLLEKKIEKLLSLPSSKRVICLSSGTSALHAIMFLCKQKYNTKKWVVPAFNFPSPVVGGAFDVDVLDIDLDSYTLNMADKTLKEYDGVIITNLFGTHSNMKEWEQFCKKKGKILIFDNASSPLTKVDGESICSFGDYSFSSLHHTKTLGFGEGGFAVVNKEDYRALSAIGGFGYLEERIHSPLSSNFKISDVSSAYILSHISNFSIKNYIDIQSKILSMLRDVGIAPFNYRDGVVYGNLPILFNKKVEVNNFAEYNIEVKKYYRPLTRLKNSLDIYSRIINFPLHTDLKESDIANIVNSIKEMY